MYHAIVKKGINQRKEKYVKGPSKFWKKPKKSKFTKKPQPKLKNAENKTNT